MTRQTFISYRVVSSAAHQLDDSVVAMPMLYVVHRDVVYPHVVREWIGVFE